MKKVEPKEERYIMNPLYDPAMARKRYLGLIPARGGSKRIPGKNLKLLGGKPLITHTIDAALASKVLWKVVVSTDDDSIARVAEKAGAEVPFRRPRELATDEASTVSVVKHALQFYRDRGEAPDAVVVLQPTSPLRLPEDIAGAVILFESSVADTVVGIFEEPIKVGTLAKVKERGKHPMLEVARPEEFGEHRLKINGAIYVVRASLVLETGRLYGDKVVGYRMPAERSIDIDTVADWKLTEMYMGAAG